MKKIAFTIATLLFLAPIANAQNYPCSGRKGGIASCTTNGKFMCVNGTLSKSKRTCHGYGISGKSAGKKPVKKARYHR